MAASSSSSSSGARYLAAAGRGNDEDDIDGTNDIISSADLLDRPLAAGAGPSSSSSSNPHSNPDVAELLRHWGNEKVSPEILPYAIDVVKRIEERVRTQTSMILDGEGTKWALQMQSWYQLDCDRIRYVLNSYKRVRLFKIQKWFLHLHASPQAKKALSSSELAFLNDYHKIRTAHLQNSVLTHLHERDRTLGAEDGQEAGPETRLYDGPSLNKLVFVRALETFRVETDPVLSVRRQGNEEAYEDADRSTMLPGNMQILPYALVRPFLRDGTMEGC